jgi:endonuclease/exonuclease/phosphatase family metal-dependent hydrolase
LITYNIRLDIESDGINKWDNRKEGLISLIKEENPDVLGIQEGLPNQIEYISKQLEDYNMIGEGRDGGDKGEYSAIFYKSEKLRLEKAETFWLSESPEVPSIGWDAALNRITTVGVFSEVSSNKKFIVYNSHFDHIGKIARENSVNVILNHIRENNHIKKRIIVMGDPHINFPIKNPLGTFNGFELDSKVMERIDYIFTSNLKVVDYRHIYKRLPNNLWPSDHIPIFISVNL